jgi:hypothetical protein
MPGRRYGGYGVGNKYVRASRRHQVNDDYGPPPGLGGRIAMLLIYGVIFWILVSLYQSF